MRDGFGLVVFFGILFIGWLMYSSKSDKEVFLFYFWALTIGGGILYYAFKFVIR